MPYYACYLLPEGERRRLLTLFPPRHVIVIAHHVTQQFDVPADHPAPEMPAYSSIVGRAEDDGLECLVVALDGSTARPDGGIYHITWSHQLGRMRAESNRLLAERGFTPLAPIAFTPVPAVLARE